MTDQANVVPFGKHKGRLIEELLIDDPGYLEWLAGQDWFRAKYVTLHQVIINRGAEPEETPEHNALQVLFLDDDECLKFLRIVVPDLDANLAKISDEARDHDLKLIAEHVASEERELQKIEERLRCKPSDPEWWKKQLEDHLKRLQRLIEVRHQVNSPIELEFHIKRAFEVAGVDVQLDVSVDSKPHRLAGLSADELKYGWSLWSAVFKIEIKPTVGDDYPAVLRQMRANGSNVLFLERYTGTGATREQFIKTFETASMKVVFWERQ